ncbi:MAG: hypothetical protein A2583_15170 [Bdellovibrionales bacterium RIFOXYD1_FULL_53_11]|nr:MAG: hypothetical protein A2583_15170 [Bdellovibrionales bacterium RIFOXYD1_FULL_53_11]
MKRILFLIVAACLATPFIAGATSTVLLSTASEESENSYKIVAVHEGRSPLKAMKILLNNKPYIDIPAGKLGSFTTVYSASTPGGSVKVLRIKAAVNANGGAYITMRFLQEYNLTDPNVFNDFNMNLVNNAGTLKLLTADRAVNQFDHLYFAVRKKYGGKEAGIKRIDVYFKGNKVDSYDYD